MNRFVPFNPSDIEQSIPHRFSEQVRRFSEKTAIAECGKSISYRTLDGWSNEVAHAIFALRGDAPQPVAI
ncbi:MAG: hypothetical protein KJO31_17565, partial [Gammaproteobacteria bacterium]|nr:hypothetical protein [Gammaproteobacteria bacterium]